MFLCFVSVIGFLRKYENFALFNVAFIHFSIWVCHLPPHFYVFLVWVLHFLPSACFFVYDSFFPFPFIYVCDESFYVFVYGGLRKCENYALFMLYLDIFSIWVVVYIYSLFWNGFFFFFCFFWYWLVNWFSYGSGRSSLPFRIVGNRYIYLLMEGLASSRIIPIRASCRRHYSVFLPTFSLQLRNKNLNKGQDWMMRRPKSLDSVAASIQPLEASTTGNTDNRLPSKGFFFLFIFQVVHIFL